MIQILNLILLTSDELLELRTSLKNILKIKPFDKNAVNLFVSLYRLHKIFILLSFTLI